MSQSRETINLDKEIARSLLSSWGNKEFDGYVHVENKITHADEEDGGADHTLIIKRVSDGKYFKKNYCDWDIKYNYDTDWDGYFRGVFAKQITITVFE